MGCNPDQAEKGLGNRVVEGGADIGFPRNRDRAAGMGPQVIYEGPAGPVVLDEDRAAQSPLDGLDALEEFEGEGEAVLLGDPVTVGRDWLIESGESGESLLGLGHLVIFPFPAGDGFAGQLQFCECVGIAENTIHHLDDIWARAPGDVER